MANESLILGNSNWAVKANNLLGYAVGETSGYYVPREFTFSRNSTATYTDENGIIQTAAANIARVQDNALLLEPQRTNLALYSEDIDNAAFWALTNSGTVTANTTISPDGTQNADTLNAGANFSQVQGAIVGTSGAVYTVSIWVKRITGTGNVFLRAVENANTLISVTSDWQRFTATVTSTTTIIRIGINLATSGDAVAIWGAQLEQGSYPTSYIKTTNATATRLADSCSKTGISSLIGQTEGTLFLDFKALAQDSESKRLTLSDGTLANRITLATNDNIISGFINVANVTQYSFYESGINVTNNTKVAVKYAQNNFAIFINGVKYDPSTSGNTFASGTLTKFSFDNAVASNNMIGNINQVLLFTSALTDAECIELTTL